MEKKGFLISLVLMFLLVGATFAQNANSTTVQYPLLTNTEVQAQDFKGQPVYNALAYLQNLPQLNVSETVTGDTTAAVISRNVDNIIVNLPCQAKILSATFITTVPNGGSDNLPSVFLLAGTDTVGTADSLAASRSAGALSTLTLTTSETTVASGTNLILRVFTPAGATLSPAIQGKLQVIWKPYKSE